MQPGWCCKQHFFTKPRKPHWLGDSHSIPANCSQGRSDISCMQAQHAVVQLWVGYHVWVHTTRLTPVTPVTDDTSVAWWPAEHMQVEAGRPGVGLGRGKMVDPQGTCRVSAAQRGTA